MNSVQLAQSAYSSGQQAPLRTHRGTEYAAFSRVTSRLKSPRNFNALVAAIHENRQLWTALAADVADAENGLSPDLRARIFYLARFTSGHSSKVLRRKANVVPLIEINMAVMRGLGASPAAAAPRSTGKAPATAATGAGK
ncbi:flagellar biosynthesis regulatory protein FlaF [Vannielia litorea]|nr:flagellar biosynthesis regulator FlaF [Vannielia litorea]MBS8226148.1 flagellar biosynthesis regulatory protein FlaF [Vannielia litorea]